MPRGNDPGQRLRSPGAPTARRRLPGRVPRTLRCPERFETRLRHAAAPHNPIGDELQLIDLKGVVAVPRGPRYNRVSARMTTTPRDGARVEGIVHRHVDAQRSTPHQVGGSAGRPTFWWHSGPRRRPAPTGRVGDSFRMIADPRGGWHRTRRSPAPLPPRSSPRH